MSPEIAAVVAHIRAGATEHEAWSVESSTTETRLSNAEIAMTLYKLALDVATGKHIAAPMPGAVRP